MILIVYMWMDRIPTADGGVIQAYGVLPADTVVSGGGFLPAYGIPRDMIVPYSQLSVVSPGGVGVLSANRTSA